MQGNGAGEWEEEPISREASCPTVSNIQRRFLISPISSNFQRPTSLRLTQVVHFPKEGDSRSFILDLCVPTLEIDRNRSFYLDNCDRRNMRVAVTVAIQSSHLPK